jgi:D-alanine-D-alanine ligase
MAKKTPLKIGILMGGLSSEKEISLESGRHVYNSLNTPKYKPIPIFIDHKAFFWQITESLLWLNTCTDIEEQLEEAEKINYENLSSKIDFAFLTAHGKFGEECLPALLHLLKIPTNVSGVLGGAINMDKFFQRKLLLAHGLDVPKTVGIEKENAGYKITYLSQNKFAVTETLTKTKLLAKLTEQLNHHLIIKPSREGCSLAVNKVNNEADLENALEEAFKHDNLILAEEFLYGKEITTTVIGNENPFALTPSETPSKGDYLTVEEKFLPGDAQMITPPNLTAEVIKKIKADCVRAYQTLELSVFSRLDGFWTNDQRFVILEPNSPPGLTPSTCVFHQAAEEGWSPTDFLEKVINLGFSAHSF